MELPNHNFIDDFNQTILWLNVSTIKNNLLFIANFYLSCTSKYKMCDASIGLDRGNASLY